MVATLRPPPPPPVESEGGGVVHGPPQGRNGSPSGGGVESTPSSPPRRFSTRPVPDSPVVEREGRGRVCCLFFRSLLSTPIVQTHGPLGFLRWGGGAPAHWVPTPRSAHSRILAPHFLGCLKLSVRIFGGWRSLRLSPSFHFDIC